MPKSTPDRLRVRDGRAFGFYQVNNEVLDDHGHALGPYALAVYHALCRYAGNGDDCRPSHAILAHVCGMSRRSVFTALRALETAGLIAVAQRRDARGQTTNEYTLLSLTPCTTCMGEDGVIAPSADAPCAMCELPHAPGANEEERSQKQRREEENPASKNLLETWQRRYEEQERYFRRTRGLGPRMG